MKSSIKKLALGVMAAALLITGAAAAETAKPSTHSLYVNGEQVDAGAYEILGNNYFKLRDIATMLNGTEKQFEVKWLEEYNAIDIYTEEEYTAVGGEMEPVGEENQVANDTVSLLYIDNIEAAVTGYNINFNNYFMLRDVGQLLDFYIGWNEAEQRIDIDTTRGYDAEDASDAGYDADDADANADDADTNDADEDADGDAPEGTDDGDADDSDEKDAEDTPATPDEA